MQTGSGPPDVDLVPDRRAELGLPRDLKAVLVSKYRGKGFQPLTASGMRQALKRWLKRAEVDCFTFHGFRHAYTIYSLRNLANLLDVKDQMGHASIKTTATYAEVVNAGRASRRRKTSPWDNLNLDGETIL